MKRSLHELTSRTAIMQAIDEYDRIGRDEFLARYGFGRARSYFLRYNGRNYDSKAIAGVACGFQHPEWGPLKPEDFSGGEATVQRKLESLGFEVINTAKTRN